MFNIKTFNNISENGLNVLRRRMCRVSEEVENPEGILLRSADLHSYEMPEELLAIARAGAGYNNIPIEECAEKGIVVFNTPGANAEAVKELELCSLVMAGRDVLGAIEYVKSIAGQGDKIPAMAEKAKSRFNGPELWGKTLGVLGLGATGALIANIAVELGMNVMGYDPYLSVDAAWRLSREIKHVENVEEIYAQADYISLNIPYTETTKRMINEKAFRKMKRGMRIINESRAEVVDNEAMKAALISGIVAKYVTDFPTDEIIGAPNVIVMPHIGACTPESEDKCAVMAAEELYDYLENGNIRNSVNLPNASLNRMGAARLCVLHRNQPRMLTGILDLISDRNINVEHMINKPRGEYAYTIVDLGEVPDAAMIETIRENPNVLRVRMIK